MIEKWVQITCDGCGDTEWCGTSNGTAKDFREEMKTYHWVNYGKLDYCPLCVDCGRAKQRSEDMEPHFI